MDQSLRADDVAEVVARLVAQRVRPDAIKVDNGSEFAGKVMDHSAYENGVELDCSRHGTSTDNANEERPTVHWHGEPLRSFPESTGPEQIPWRQKRAKSLPADCPAWGWVSGSGPTLICAGLFSA